MEMIKRFEGPTNSRVVFDKFGVSTLGLRRRLLAGAALSSCAIVVSASPVWAQAAPPCTNVTTTSSGMTLDLAGVSCSVSTTATTVPTFTNTSLVTNSVANPATLTVSAPNAQNVAFPGQIADGAGQTSFTYQGGSVNASGASTYTGATTVSSGTLQITSTGSLGTSTTPSGALTVANGATFNNAGSVYVTSANNAGNLSLTGGSLVVTGGLTNSGTLIRASGASLNVQNGPFTNTGTVTMPTATNGITTNGTGIVFNNNAGGVFNTQTTNANKNVINNNAGATWNGDLNIANVATVNNAGTWTSVSAGYVNAGTLNTTGTLNAAMGGVANSGTLNASGSLIGTVTNTGIFNVTGPLTGITTFTQQAGTLNLGGTTLSASNPVSLFGGTIMNGSIVGPGNTINAIVSGGGTVSNVTNTALVAVSGSTVVQGGSFPALYTSQGATVTASGGLSFVGVPGVGGVGTINGNVSVGNGANIAPGTFTAALGSTGYTVANTGPGTLTVNGNVALTNGSTLQVAVTPTAASRLTVNGAAALGNAALSISGNSNSNFQPSTQYTIVSATSGVSGIFGATSSNLAFLTPTLSYDANDAYLTLTRNQTSIQSVASPNSVGVANAIGGPGQNSQLGQAFLGLTAAQAQAALNSISGEGNVSVQTIGQNATRAFTSFISDRATPDETGGQGAVEASSNAGLPASASQYAALATTTSPIVVDRPQPPKKWRVFATGFGGGSNLQGQDAAGIAGQTGSYYGGLLGLDYRVSSDLLIGAAAGGSSSNFLVASRGSSGNVTGFNGNVFSIVSFGAFYGQSLTTVSSFSNDTTRNIAGFGGLASAVEKASFGSLEVRTRAEFGRVVNIENEFGINKFKITPFVALELAKLHTNGYSEYNASGGSNVFNLSAQGTDYTDVRSFIGGRFEASYVLANGMTLRPIVRLAYVHAFTDAPVSTNTFQSIPTSTFVVAGANVAHNAAETKAGAELDLGLGRVIFANFEGEFSGIQQVYGGRGGFRISF